MTHEYRCLACNGEVVDNACTNQQCPLCPEGLKGDIELLLRIWLTMPGNNRAKCVRRECAWELQQLMQKHGYDVGRPIRRTGG